jgi:dipeptidyl aminopeptidase/acylaminoacyl peptidase
MIETAPSMPDRIYFKEGNKEELWISASDFSPSCFNKENLIRYPSFDGKTISAFYFPSKNNHPSKKALVFVKEGPHDPFRPTFRADIQYWIQNGWSLLIPNYRGTTSYGIDFEEADDGEKRLQSAHDISSALKWLEKMGTPLKNSAVLGEGYGATLALLSLDFSPKPFAFVGLNGSLDWGEFTEKKSLLENTLWKKELGSEQDLKNLTLESRLKKTSIPILWESVEYPTLTSLRKSMSFLDRSFSQPLNSK